MVVIVSAMLWVTVEPIPLPDVCGYAVLQVCATQQMTQHHYSPRLVMVPGTVTMMSNPPHSPAECVKIYFGGTQGIYVLGTYQEIAAKLHKASEERRLNLCKW